MYRLPRCLFGESVPIQTTIGVAMHCMPANFLHFLPFLSRFVIRLPGVSLFPRVLSPADLRFFPRLSDLNVNAVHPV